VARRSDDAMRGDSACIAAIDRKPSARLMVLLALLHNDGLLMFLVTCGMPVSSAAEEGGDIRSLRCEVQASAVRAAQHRLATFDQ
jgi:hypothetical protein